MQSVAINWHVYLLTRSPLALGFVGLARVIPIVVFSLWGGVLADRLDRRKLMVVTQIVMAVVAARARRDRHLHGPRIALASLRDDRLLRRAPERSTRPRGRRSFRGSSPTRTCRARCRSTSPSSRPGMIVGPALAGWIIAGHALVPGAAATAARQPRRGRDRRLDGRARVDLPRQRALVPRGHLRPRRRCTTSGKPAAPRGQAAGTARRSARGAAVRLPHAAHRLDDGRRLPRDVLRRRDVASSDLRRPGAEGRRDGIRLPRVRAGRRRARRIAAPLGPPAARPAGTRSSSGRSRPTASRRSSSASRGASR